MAGLSAELQDLTNKLDVAAGAYGMEVSTTKSKIKVNSVINVEANIMMGSEQLEVVSSFKYLGATLFKDGSNNAEIRIRIAHNNSSNQQAGENMEKQ